MTVQNDGAQDNTNAQSDANVAASMTQAVLDKSGAEAAKVASAAPEKYEFKFQDGVSINPAIQQEYEKLAREAGLSNEKAQALLNLSIKEQQAEMQRVEEQRSSTIAKWQEECRNDKEFGGLEFDKNVELANRAVRQFAPEEVVKLLDQTGLANHPKVVAMFVRIGKAISEHSSGQLGQVGSTELSDADLAKKWFPNTPQMHK